MKLTPHQTKFLQLTTELDIKTRDYKTLCDRLDELKLQNLDANCKEYQELYTLFLKNYDEIVEINKKLKLFKVDKK